MLKISPERWGLSCHFSPLCRNVRECGGLGVARDALKEQSFRFLPQDAMAVGGRARAIVFWNADWRAEAHLPSTTRGCPKRAEERGKEAWERLVPVCQEQNWAAQFEIQPLWEADRESAKSSGPSGGTRTQRGDEGVK